MKKSFEANETVCNSLGVVQPVNGKDYPAIAKTLFYFLCFFKHAFQLGRSIKLRIINSQREKVNTNNPFPNLDSTILMIIALDHSHRFQKVLNVFMRMKPDQVCAQYTLCYFLLPRFMQKTKDFVGRKGYVQKEPNCCMRYFFANHRR